MGEIMFKLFTSIFITVTLILSSVLSGAIADTSKHTDPDYKGFYWYDRVKEDVKEELKEKEPPAPITPPVETKKPEKVVINSEWLKVNLPKLQAAAQDNPTDENLANYYYAQRLMLDIGSRFSERTKEFFMNEPVLNEALRRPTMASSLIVNKDKIRSAKEEVVRKMNDKYGVFFFYRSDCPYCHNQSHSMYLMQKNLGLDVLGVSLDGRKLLAKNSDKYKHRYDPNNVLAKKYNITITPTTMLVNYQTGEAYPISYGQASYTGLVDKTLSMLNQIDAIPEEQYAKTQSVNNIVALDDDEEGIVFDKAELESNPEKLAQELRRRLEQRTGVRNAGITNE